MIHIGGRKRIEPHLITNMDADENYTIVTMNTGKKIIVATTLKVMEARFEAHKNFIRVNRSLILNTDYALIQDGSFLLPDQRIVGFSRRRLRKFNSIS